MSSGRRTIVENTRERVVSTDWNRTQAFANGFSNEAIREQMLVPVDDSFGVGTTFTALGPLTTAIDITVPSAPEYAGILNGLMVIAPLTATYLLITSGMVAMVDPEGQPGSSDPSPANPDDGPGPARTVWSEGVSNAGALAWTPNPGPGARVDIVECQRTFVVAETDNRDIFNPATGQFSPGSVVKATTGGLTFRIRQGTAGGGLPAPAIGWIPIAVISAPAGAANLDTCEIWDVRPLLSDLASPFAQVRNVIPRIDRCGMSCSPHEAPGELRLSGESVGIFLGWKIGGLFYEPGAVGQGFLNLAQTQYFSSGFSPAASTIYYLYALWPGGYVRWVRYWKTPLAGTGGRTPGPCRGILAISHILSINGIPTAPIGVPSSWGIGGSTSIAMALMSSVTDTGALAKGFVDDGQMTQIEQSATAWKTVIGTISVPGGPTTEVSFSLTPGVDFPFGSKRLRVGVSAIISALGGANPQVFVSESHHVRETVSGLQISYQEGATSSHVQPDGFVFVPIIRTVNIPAVADGVTVPASVQHVWTIDHRQVAGNGNGTIAAAQLVVLGWSNDR